MKRLLITGGIGYLGHRLVQIAHKWEVTYTWFRTPPSSALRGQAKQVDLRDTDQVQQLFAACRPDAIIHTACSDRSEAAIVPAARNIIASSTHHAGRLVHISTDMVLGGTHPPYSDDAVPCPLSSYGKAKAKAERMVVDALQSAVIVRTSLIFGVDPLDRQTGWLVHGLQNGREVQLFKDEYRCPIWVDNLATALLELAGSNYAGFLNVAGTKSLNRWEFGLRMLSLLGIQPGTNVRPATLAESGLTRPADLTLDTRRAQSLLCTPLLTVDKVIDQIQAPTALEV